MTFASRACTAAVTSSIRPAGTNARRIAVHFCPALTVISVTSCLTYRSNSRVPAVASGPRMEQLSESASALNRTEFRTIRRVRAQPLRRWTPTR